MTEFQQTIQELSRMIVVRYCRNSGQSNEDYNFEGFSELFKNTFSSVFTTDNREELLDECIGQIKKHIQILMSSNLKYICFVDSYESFVFADRTFDKPAQFFGPYFYEGGTNNSDIGEITLALQELQSVAQQDWHKCSPLVQALCAPALLYESLSNGASYSATQLYLKLFSAEQRVVAKQLLIDNPYWIYIGEQERPGATRVAAKFLFKDDPVMLQKLLPYMDYYIFYTLAGYNQFDDLKICWEAASTEQRNELCKTFFISLGDVRDPVLVYAYNKKNSAMYTWCWSHIKEHDLQKTCIETLIKGKQRDGLTSFFLPVNNEKNIKVARSLLRYDDSISDDTKLRDQLDEKVASLIAENKMREGCHMGTPNDMHKQSENELNEVRMPTTN